MDMSGFPHELAPSFAVSRYLRLKDLIEDQTRFSREKFGQDHERGPAGPLRHIAIEILHEFLGYPKEAVKKFVDEGPSIFNEEDWNPENLSDETEYADLLILLLDAIRRSGSDFWKIVEAAKVKMVENWARDWPPFDPSKANRVVEHVRQPEGEKLPHDPLAEADATAGTMEPPSMTPELIAAAEIEANTPVTAGTRSNKAGPGGTTFPVMATADIPAGALAFVTDFNTAFPGSERFYGPAVHVRIPAGTNPDENDSFRVRKGEVFFVRKDDLGRLSFDGWLYEKDIESKARVVPSPDWERLYHGVVEQNNHLTEELRLLQNGDFTSAVGQKVFEAMMFDRNAPSETHSKDTRIILPANARQEGGDHYKAMAIEPWDYIHSNDFDWFTGSIIRYMSRWKNKNGVEDLKKARHFIDKMIEQEERR